MPDGTLSSKIRVGIIGLGQIAEGYDQPSGPAINTHIKACLSIDDIEIVSISDIQQERISKVKSKWNLSARRCSAEEFFRTAHDVICIATPDDTHADLTRRAIGARPKAILCEKPLAATSDTAKSLLDQSLDKNVTITVAYLRRWIPGLREWIDSARSLQFGAPVAASCTYTRGLKHNCCHALDIIASAMPGEVVAAQTVGEPIADWNEKDLTRSLFCSMRTNGKIVPLSIVGTDGRVQDVFELTLLFERSSLRIWNENGVRMAISHCQKSAIEGLAAPLVPAITYHDNPPAVMNLMWADIVRHVRDGYEQVYCGHDAIGGIALLEQLISGIS